VPYVINDREPPAASDRVERRALMRVFQGRDASSSGCLAFGGNVVQHSLRLALGSAAACRIRCMTEHAAPQRHSTCSHSGPTLHLSSIQLTRRSRRYAFLFADSRHLRSTSYSAIVRVVDIVRTIATQRLQQPSQLLHRSRPAMCTRVCFQR
jgi:hypothetical protein